MPLTNEVTFYGGPCDGVTRPFTDAQLHSGVVACGGVQYVVQGQAPHMYVAQPLATASGGTASAETFAPDLFRAYDDLRRSIARRLRPAVTKAQRYDRLALQALARHHKVRKH